MTRYRTGRHWGTTIVREGERDGIHIVEPDQLVAVIVNGDHTLAERICQLLNADQRLAEHMRRTNSETTA